MLRTSSICIYRLDHIDLLIIATFYILCMGVLSQWRGHIVLDPVKTFKLCSDISLNDWAHAVWVSHLGSILQ